MTIGIFVIVGSIVVILIVFKMAERKYISSKVPDSEKDSGKGLRREDRKYENQQQNEYAIYKSPTGATEAIKKGWSWPGFFFTWIWAFVKNLYIVGAVVLGIGVLALVNPYVEAAFAIIVGFVVGAKGNEARQNNLLKKGFQFRCKISALTPEGALALFAQEQNTQGAQVSDYTQKPQTNGALSNLIDCPDCKKAVSRKAVACPGCGCPIVA